MLASISIDYDSSKKEIYLTGDVDALKKNRFAWRYVKDYLHPIVEEKRIVISINEDEPFSVLSKISSMLSKYGFSEVQSDSSEQVLQDYFNEEQRFGEFSKKALDIRNNDCNAEEFKHFTDAVAEHLPARSLYPLQLLQRTIWLFHKMLVTFPCLVQVKRV